MCIAEDEIPNETWQQYAGLAHIAVSDVSAASGNFLKDYGN